MDTRHLIAYALIAFMALAAFAVALVAARKRKEQRRIMQGRRRRP